MQKRIAVIPGDGIGPEVCREAVKVLQAVQRASGHEFLFTELDWGAKRYLATGVALPEEACEQLRANQDAILLGALGDARIPTMQHVREILLGLRVDLDLYVNIRPIRLYHHSLSALRAPKDGSIDFVIFRENTEGHYVGVGGVFKKGTRDEVALEEEVNTYQGVERILRYAFDYAQQNGKKRLLMSDKSNALRYGQGLWQRVFAELIPQYPTIEASHMYVDNLACQMVRDPTQFEVIVTCNLFGDILSDLGGWVGGWIGYGALGQYSSPGALLVRTRSRFGA